jgi:transcriptional regulator with XRE-family HTH domain
MVIKMNFGDFIKQKRTEKGLNLRKLAELVDIAPAYMSDIEKGKRNSPSSDKMSKLAEILELTPEEVATMYDLAAGTRTNTVAPDISEYVMKNDSVRIALRKARELDLGEKEWLKIIESMTSDKTEGN